MANLSIRFLGAAQTVTGSMHLLSLDGRRVLLDCGLFQGKRSESFARNRNFDFDPTQLDAVVLSHAHIDHAGNLPNLVRNGYRGPIYCTAATRDLCNVMLFDSAYIQERDVAYLNKKHRKLHQPEVEPLYTVDDARRAMEQFVGVGYHQPFRVTEGVTATFSDAGHILGSAVTLYEIANGATPIRLGFTGDLGRKNSPIIRDPESLGAVDYLMMESTYGGRIHEPITGMKASLRDVIGRTITRGGKVIIPAFSIERTQELVYSLFELFDDGSLPAIPVFVDSPLAVNATDVFRMHPECFDDETIAHLHANEDPFGFGRLTYIRDVESSKRLNDIKTPCIIIAASGMCEAGRILHHLANNVTDPGNTVMIVGYQAEHTLGRRIAERQPEIKMFGEMYPLKAEVAVMHAFSAHAGQDELAGYVNGLDRKRLRSIFLVHGDPDQAQALEGVLRADGFDHVHIPERGETVTLA